MLMTSFSDPTPSFTLMDTQGAAIVVTYVVEGEVCVENFEYGAAKPVVPLPPFTQSNSLYSSASGGFVTSGPGEPTSNPEHVVCFVSNHHPQTKQCQDCCGC
ncbi:hypothetical protein V8E55_007662 [Tylopilus felleus]